MPIETLACPMCHLPFDLHIHLPRIIPKCGHTFCEKCISSNLIVRGNRRIFVCKECSAQVVIRKGVQDDMPRNIGVMQIVKNGRKQREKERQKQVKKENECEQHQKPLDLICQTCKFQPICSHCVLFGSHHGHNFCKEPPVSALEMNELHSLFQLIKKSANQSILPPSPLLSKTKLSISNLLKNAIQSHFKQYYSILEKKEAELCRQCDELMIGGGIQKSVEILISEFEDLKDEYESRWTKGNGRSGKEVDNFITNCENFHQKVDGISKAAESTVQKIVDTLGKKIGQASFFKIIQLPFSIKKIITQESSSVSQISKSRQKSSTSQSRIAPSSSQIKNSSLKKNNYMSERPSQPLPSKPQYNSQIPRSKEQILKAKHIAKSNLEIAQPPLQLKQIISNKHISIINDKEKQSKNKANIPPSSVKIPRPKNADSLEQTNKTINVKQPSKHILPNEVSPAKSVNVRAASKGASNFDKKQTIVSQYINVQDFKFVRPTKEISYGLSEKFQDLTKQIDRQFQSSSPLLQILSSELTDQLLLYVLDYLYIKKYKFQIFKIIKNSITDEGLRYLLSYLCQDNVTQVLNMTGNCLSSKSLQMIIAFSQRNKILRSFYLGGNKISGAIIKSRKGTFQALGIQITV